MDALGIWEKAKIKIKENIGDTTFETWIASTQAKQTPAGGLVLEVPDKFFKEWLTSHYLNIIQDCLHICGYEGGVEVKINPYILKPLKKKKFSQFEFQFQEPQDLLTLNPRYTFENFVVGASNKFAHAVSLSVATSPGQTYNPLFLYGGVGLGKTHLLQAIAHKVRKDNPEAKVVYLSSEVFINELIRSIQNHSTERFRKKFRQLDLLLIDDIHFLGGKESTQEEFFHTFNFLYDNHKQIVISSDRPPKDLPRMEERLISRFVWGMVADIQPPDFETRIAILRKKIEKEPVEIPQEVLEFIAEKITTNIRELEGALIRVLAYSLVEEKVVDLELAKEVLKDMLKETKVLINIEKIQDMVCKYFDLSVDELKSESRFKNIVLPRQIAMYLARKLTNLSLPEISKSFGKKDHTTILHSVKKIRKLTKEDSKIKSLIEDIEQEIKKF